MEIKLAKSAGFCFGVKRAVDMVYEQAQRERNAWTPGKSRCRIFIHLVRSFTMKKW